MATPTFSDGHLLGGRYTITRLIGIGRTVEVYEVDDTSLRRRVVAKVLRPELCAYDDVKRAFRDHIVRAATLSHPHLARVYDGGQEHGATFMISEYLPGDTLEAAFEGGLVLSVEDGARMARDIASALHYAHLNGFVHGNLSPSKILFDTEGHVRVSDISVAGLADGYRDAFSINDARYLSPEQAAGAVPTARSDVYALGLMLFEAVTGRPAFEGHNVDALLRARLDGSVPAAPELGTLDILIAQATVAQPDYRFDADTLATRLGSVISDSSSFTLTVDVASPTLLDQAPAPSSRTSIGFSAPTAGELSGGPRQPVFPTPQPVRGVAPDFTELPHQRKEAFAETRPPRRGLFLVLSLLVILAGVGSAAAWKLGWFTTTHTVPSLSGLNYQSAASVIKADGFSLQINQHENSATVASGDIVTQTPAAGTSAKSGQVISVTVSDGPQMITLPTSIIGEDCVTATAQIQKLGLSAQCPTSAAIASSKVAAGRIARVIYEGSTNPVAVPAGSTLTLALSTGVGTTTTTPGTTTTTLTSQRVTTTTRAKTKSTAVTTTTATTATTATEVMPNLVGLSPSEMKAIAHEYLLYYVKRGPGAAEINWGRVVSQSPAAGTAVKKLSTAYITVSK